MSVMMLHSASEPGCSSSEEISAGLGCIFNAQHKNRERCNGFLFSNKLPAVPPGSQGDVGGQKNKALGYKNFRRKPDSIDNAGLCSPRWCFSGRPPIYGNAQGLFLRIALSAEFPALGVGSTNCLLVGNNKS